MRAFCRRRHTPLLLHHVGALNSTIWSVSRFRRAQFHNAEGVNSAMRPIFRVYFVIFRGGCQNRPAFYRCQSKFQFAGFPAYRGTISPAYYALSRYIIKNTCNLWRCKMKFYIVDAFTETLFGGNPAGVVILPE